MSVEAQIVADFEEVVAALSPAGDVCLDALSDAISGTVMPKPAKYAATFHETRSWTAKEAPSATARALMGFLERLKDVDPSTIANEGRYMCTKTLNDGAILVACSGINIGDDRQAKDQYVIDRVVEVYESKRYDTLAMYMHAARSPWRWRVAFHTSP